MKKHLVFTVLFTLLVTMPGYADCPMSRTDNPVKISTTKATAVVSHSYATPESTISWHDLHWFE